MDKCERKDELLKVYKDAEKEAMKQDKFVAPMLALGLSDRKFQGGNDWPPLPAALMYVVHYVFGRRHRGAWRFLPCDTWGTPKPLLFIEEKEK